MIVVRDLQSTDQISNPDIRALVAKRIDDLGGEAFDSADIGYFLVVEPGDTIEAIHAQVGFNILHNRFTGVRFDGADFTPSFEFIEEFPYCYDTVYILDDSGFGVEIFVPTEVGVNSELLTMCRPHPSPIGSVHPVRRSVSLLR